MGGRGGGGDPVEQGENAVPGGGGTEYHPRGRLGG